MCGHVLQVVTPDTPGRRLHVAGLYVDPEALKQTIAPVDMLLCEVATGDEEDAEAAGLLTPRRAAELAAVLQAECLVVWARCPAAADLPGRQNRVAAAAIRLGALEIAVIEWLQVCPW